MDAIGAGVVPMSMDDIIERTASDIPEGSLESMKLVCLSAHLLHADAIKAICNSHELLWALYRGGVFTSTDYVCLRMMLRAEKLYDVARRLDAYELEAKTRARERAQRSHGNAMAGTHAGGITEAISVKSCAPRDSTAPKTSAEAGCSPEARHLIMQETDRAAAATQGKLYGSVNFVRADAQGETPALASPMKEHADDGDRFPNDKPRTSSNTSTSTFCTSCHGTSVGTSTLQSYDLRPGKGLVLVINMEEFDNSAAAQMPPNSGLKDRKGSVEDVKKLCEVFNEFLGYQVEIRQNLAADQLLEFLQEVATRDHCSTDCLVCVLMSHGSRDKIFTSDCKLLALSAIVQVFKGCKQLKNKPKLFFTQACRGGAAEHAMMLTLPLATCTTTTSAAGSGSDSTFLSGSDDDDDDDEGSEYGYGEQSLPRVSINDSDILIGFPTTPRGDAFRNEVEGSWYIQTLCNAIRDLVPRHETLLDILTTVNRKVSDIKQGPMRQTPMPNYTLKQRLVFPCPLCRDCRCSL